MPPTRPPGMPFVFVTMLLDVVGIGLLVPVSPMLVASFVGGDVSAASHALGPLVATYTLAQFACAPMLGALSDRFGRRPLLLGATAASAIAYAGTALAPGLGWLFATRLLTGVAAASMSVASAYVADVSSDENRAQHFGLLGMAYALGFTLGPALGGALGHLGLRVPFWVAAGLAFANLVYGLVVLPESHPASARTPFDARRLNPLSFVATLRRHPVVAGMTAAIVLVGLAQQCQNSTWVLFTRLQFGWGPAEAGASIALSAVCGVLVQGVLLPAVMPRWGARRAMVVGLGGYALALGLSGLAPSGWVFCGLVAVAAVAGLVGPSAQALMGAEVPAAEQGALQGAVTSLMSLTGVVGPLVATGLFAACTAPGAAVYAPGAAFFLGAAMLGAAALAMARPAAERSPTHALE